MATDVMTKKILLINNLLLPIYLKQMASWDGSYESVKIPEGGDIKNSGLFKSSYC